MLSAFPLPLGWQCGVSCAFGKCEILELKNELSGGCCFVGFFVWLVVVCLLFGVFFSGIVSYFYNYTLQDLKCFSYLLFQWG